MKLNLIICDDIEEHRDLMKASLINTSSAVDMYTRINMAEEMFNIHDYAIVGEAISRLQNSKSNIDFAVFDADYSNLNDDYIIDSGYDPTIEKTSTRGFDLLEKLIQLNIPSFLFTGNYGNMVSIQEEIEKRGLKIRQDFFIKPTDKSIGIEALSSYTPFILKKSAEKILLTLAETERKNLNSISDSVDNKTSFLNYQASFNGRRIEISNLLMGWSKAKLDSKNNLILHYDNPKQIFEELLNSQTDDLFTPNGIWRGIKTSKEDYRYMTKALKDYREHTRYLQSREEINKRSAQCLLELIEQIYSKTPYNQISYSVKIKNNNCKYQRTDNTIENAKFKQKFFNALVCRRMLIGLTKVRDSRKTDFNKRDIIDIFTSSLGRKIDSYNNVKQFITDILGLSGEINTAQRQSVNFTMPKIMREEKDWLDEYIPIIEDRINHRKWFTLFE